MPRQASALQQNETQDRYRSFIRTSKEGIWRLELDEPVSIKLSIKKQIQYIFERAYLAEANDAFARAYHFRSAKPLIGKRLSDLLSPENPDHISYITAFITNNYTIDGLETSKKGKNGHDKYFRKSLIGIVENNQLVHIWGTQQDITEQKQTVAALEKNEERLKLALQSSNTALWEWDSINKEMYWSDELKTLFGLKPNAKVDHIEYMSLIHPDDRDAVLSFGARAWTPGETYEFEHRVVWPDKSIHWLRTKGRAYFNGNKATRIIGTTTNIDNARRTQEQADRQRIFLETLNTTALETSKSIKKRAQILETILTQACKIGGTKHGFVSLTIAESNMMEMAVTSKLFEAYKGTQLGKGKGMAGVAWQTGKPVVVDNYDTWPNRLKNFPKHIFHSGIGVPLRTHGKIIGALVVTYREEKRIDSELIETLSRLADLASIMLYNSQLFNELLESEQRFRSMADTASVMIWVSGPDKACTYFNQPWQNYTGRKLEQDLGYGWSEVIHPEDLERLNRVYSESFDARTPYNCEYRIRRYDGVYRWILDKGVPRFSPTGEFQGYIGSCIDIHDMKNANDLAVAYSQLKAQRAQLIAINKTKDEFIALASHQLRTPATAVKQYIGLLLTEFAGPLNPDQTQYLQVAFDSNERQLGIINDLLKTAQIDSHRYRLDKKQQNITDIIHESVKELSDTFETRRQTISLEGLINTTLDIDAHEMKLVMINLLDNASKYSYPGTDIRVTMKKKEKVLEISVIDKGVGIAKDDTKRIFDKFSRIDNELSDTVTGTGFGLYWVKRIIALHGGKINVKSAPGEGSTFTIRLPV